MIKDHCKKDTETEGNYVIESFQIDADIYKYWLKGDVTKTVCEARNIIGL